MAASGSRFAGAGPGTRPGVVWTPDRAVADALPRPWLYGSRPAGSEAVRGPRAGSAVLFDRDGTLVRDVPYNTDPDRVEPMPTARAALDALRERGLPVGVVSNQSGVGRGLIRGAQLEAVQRRVTELLGPFDVWAVCPHAPRERCGCRKPAPGLVRAACAWLGVDPGRTVVVGDIGADLQAARGAGARGVLVPTPVTRDAEVADAVHVAPDLLTAVRTLLPTLPTEGAPPGRTR